MKYGDYLRFKFNYVLLDGNFDYWDMDKENVECIGSIFFDIMFCFGVFECYKEMFSGVGVKK